MRMLRELAKKSGLEARLRLDEIVDLAIGIASCQKHLLTIVSVVVQWRKGPS